MDNCIQPLEKEFPIGSLISPVSCRRLWLPGSAGSYTAPALDFVEDTIAVVLGFEQYSAAYHGMVIYYKGACYITAAYGNEMFKELFIVIAGYHNG